MQPCQTKAHLTSIVPFLLFAGALKWARFLFPAWVLLVSIFILILNYRYSRKHEGDEAVTLEA